MLHDLPRTLTVGGYTFPTRADYLASCANSRGLAELGANLLIAIQRDSHIRGQNGCVFAMHAARKLSAQHRVDRSPLPCTPCRDCGRVVSAREETAV